MYVKVRVIFSLQQLNGFVVNSLYEGVFMSENRCETKVKVYGIK